MWGLPPEMLTDTADSSDAFRKAKWFHQSWKQQTVLPVLPVPVPFVPLQSLTQNWPYSSSDLNCHLKATVAWNKRPRISRNENQGTDLWYGSTIGRNTDCVHQSNTNWAGNSLETSIMHSSQYRVTLLVKFLPSLSPFCLVNPMKILRWWRFLQKLDKRNYLEVSKEIRRTDV